MKYKFAAIALAAAALAVTPLAPAEAHGWGGRHDGLLLGVFAAGAAVTGAAVAIATAPFNAIASVAAPPPAPIYAAAPVYAAPAYYAYPQPVAVYGYPQGYGYYGHPHYGYR